MASANSEHYVQPHAFDKYLGIPFSKSFKCLHLNVRSIRNKAVDLNLFLDQIKPSFDVLMLTETWCTQQSEVFRKPGYLTFYLNRPTGRGGGVCILVRKAFSCEIIPQFSAMTHDYEIFTIKLQGTLLAVCYRPPSGSLTPFLEYLETLLDFVNNNKLNVICGGDVNINMLKCDPSQVKLDVLLKSNGCRNVITLPTRLAVNSSSLIDIFVTNLHSEYIRTGVLVSDLSDHLPIFLCSKEHVRIKRTNTTHQA